MPSGEPWAVERVCTKDRGPRAGSQRAGRACRMPLQRIEEGGEGGASVSGRPVKLASTHALAAPVLRVHESVHATHLLAITRSLERHAVPACHMAAHHGVLSSKRALLSCPHGMHCFHVHHGVLLHAGAAGR